MQRELLSILHELGLRCGVHCLEVKICRSQWFWAQVDPLSNLFRGKCVVKINETVLKLLELNVIDLETLRGLLAHEIGHCVNTKKTRAMGILALIAYGISLSFSLFMLSSSLDELITLFGVPMGFFLYTALMILASLFMIRYLPVVFFRHIIRYEEQKADMVALTLVGCEKLLHTFKTLESIQGKESQDRRFSLIELLIPVKYWMRVIQLDISEHIKNVERVCKARSDDLGAPLSV